MDRPQSAKLFPVSRYIDYNDFRFYYAYGNTQAEDFLASVAGVRIPSILLLGCGDIRSCLHTLWTNFDAGHKGPFDGVNFVLNDYSAGVLARNILFLYLCLQKPTDKAALKKWVATIWAIWFCHEISTEHNAVLKKALTELRSWCASLHAWTKSVANPLRNLVRFEHESSLCMVGSMWNLWLKKDRNSSGDSIVKERTEEHKRRLNDETSKAIAPSVAAAISVMHCMDTDHLQPLEDDINHYVQNGSAFAEGVLNLPMPSTEKVANATFYEREDGVYTLHYGSIPYVCFPSQFMNFTRSEMKRLGAHKSLLNKLLVTDNGFKENPLLANCVQQFSVWLISSSTVLSNACFKEAPAVSFVFACRDALEFVQRLLAQQNESHYDLINASNLIDHLSPVNLVLLSVQLLKPKGYLFASTLRYKDVALNTTSYLEQCFGCKGSLFPLMFGIRCINHEDKYASTVSVQPVPLGLGNVIDVKQWPRVLIWQRIECTPLMLISLSGFILESLISSVSKILTMFFLNHKGPTALSHVCTESILLLIQSFISQVNRQCNPFCFQFWAAFCSVLKSRRDLEPYLVCLQTHAFLHCLHWHLTVSQDDCPICCHTPLSKFLGQFTVQLSLPLMQMTPSIMAYVHKSSFTSPSQLVALMSTQEVHIVDSLGATTVKDTLNLDFFLPLQLADEDYNVSVVSYINACIFEQAVCIPSNILFSGKLSQLKSPVAYSFPQVKPAPLAPNSALGSITEHSGTGDEFSTTVVLTDAALREVKGTKLKCNCISNSELEIVCGKFRMEIAYPFPISYDTVKIQLSRVNKSVMIKTQRSPHNFYNEEPVFIVDPANSLTLPPFHSTQKIGMSYCGLMFTTKEKVFANKCDRNVSLMPPLLNLKESLNIIFQCPDEYFFHLAYNVGGVQALVVVQNHVFDVYSKTSAVDLWYRFLDKSDLGFVVPQWLSVTGRQVRSIIINESEYDFVKKAFSYFSKRTRSAPIGEVGRMKLLNSYGIGQYFTRAVVYPLYSDPDVFVHEIGLYKKYGKGASSEPPADSKPTVVAGVPESPTEQPKDTEASTRHLKCSHCNILLTKVQKCSRCRLVHYCSTKCQAKDWPKHRIVCKPTSAQRSCGFCKKEAVTLKTCPCHLVAYCSVVCQKKDWPQHKLSCTPRK